MKKILFCFLLVSLQGCAAVKSKIFSEPTALTRFEFQDAPEIGSTAFGQKIQLGAFSGLQYLGKSPEGFFRFLTHTDRGPNPEPFEKDGVTFRPFAIPDFQPRLLVIDLDPRSERLLLARQIPLFRPDGKALSGIPHSSDQENPVDLKGNKIPFDPYGADLEGVAEHSDGSYWMVEEYGPSILHFTKNGKLVESFKPGSGLPKILASRRLNRGFEGLALEGNRVYAVVQSPLDIPKSEGSANSKKSRIARIVEFDIVQKKTTAQFAYVFDGKADKIGDIAVYSPGKLMLIEQDGKTGKNAHKKIFLIDLKKATNLQLLSEALVGARGTLELSDPKKLADLGITPVEKKEIFDLAANGVLEEKVEGLSLVEGTHLAVATDNDFGLDGHWDQNTGKLGLSGESSKIYLFPLPKLD
jgi:hypothetical protein